MAAKKKTGNQNFVPLSKNDVRAKPTASLSSPKKQTASDKKAKTKADKNPQYTGKNVPVKKAESGFAGSGMPLGTSLALSRPTSAKNLSNVALSIGATPLGAGVKSKIVSKIVSKSKIPGAAGNAAWDAAAKGLSKATGAGGKVSKTFTPMGKTLRSTQIGSAKQQAARIENLTRNADRISNRAVAGAKTQIAKNVSRRINKTQQAAGVAVVASNKPKNNKSRTPKNK